MEIALKVEEADNAVCKAERDISQSSSKNQRAGTHEPPMSSIVVRPGTLAAKGSRTV